MNLDLNAGDVVAADLEIDRIAVKIAGRVGGPTGEARCPGGGRITPWHEPRDAKGAMGVGNAATSAPASWPRAALTSDVNRHAGRRLTAVGVKDATRDGVGFQRRAKAYVNALGDGAGLDDDGLRLRLFDRVRVISQGITNASAHAGPVAAARAHQVVSRGQTVDAVNAAIIGFIAEAVSSVERLRLPICVCHRHIESVGDYLPPVAVGSAPCDPTAWRKREINF